MSRRFWFVALVLSLLVVLTACGSAQSETSQSTPTPTPTPDAFMQTVEANGPQTVPTPTTSTPGTALHLQPGQPADVGGTWHISIGDTFYTTSYGGEHDAVILVSMTNTSSTSQSEDPSNWTLADASGKTYQQPSGASLSMSGQNSLSARTVNPSETATGWVFFPIPKSGAYTLVFTYGTSTASWDLSIS